MNYELRASGLPAIFACPGKLTIPEAPETEPKPAADMGTAMHKLLEMAVNAGNPPELETMEEIAQQYKADPEELKFLFWGGWNIWKDIEPRVRRDNILTEYDMETDELPGVHLTGHADLIAELDSRTIIILDWKSNREPADYEAQLKGYAYLASRNSGFQVVKTIIAYARLGVTEIRDYTLEEIRAFGRELSNLCDNDNKPFAPGSPACTYCKCKSNCPMWAERQRQAAHELATIVPEAGAVTLTPEKLAEWKPSVDALKKAIDRYEDALREAVKAQGEVKTPHGVYYMKPEERVTFAMGGELKEAIGDEAYDAALHTLAISQSALKKVLGKGAGKTIEAIKPLAKITTIEKLSVKKGGE